MGLVSDLKGGLPPRSISGAEIGCLEMHAQNLLRLVSELRALPSGELPLPELAMAQLRQHVFAAGAGTEDCEAIRRALMQVLAAGLL